MSQLPFYHPGPPNSATTENQRNRVIREGQLTGGKGLMVSRTGTGSTVSLVPTPKANLPLPLGGVLVSDSAFTYQATATVVNLTTPTGILGAIDNKLTGAQQLLDIDADSTYVTLSQPGRYLIHYQATCGYDPGTIADNVSDAVTRLRLKIGGNFQSDSSVFGTHHLKLCATGLVYDIGSLAVEEAGGSGSGDWQLTGDLAKVAAYNRWLDGRITISGTYQVIVFKDGSDSKIATASPVDDPPTAPTGTPPTIGLWVDRYDVEDAPGVAPFTGAWVTDPTMRLYDAQLHIIRLT